MPWGVAAAAVAAGGAIYAANKQSNAAKSAAQAQQDATNSASQTELQMFNQNRADQAPFRDAGLVGLNQYMQMLGLGGNATGQQYTGSGTGGTVDPSSLVTMNNGVPGMNQQLYATDPNYKQAWDQAVSEHYNEFGKNYTADSSQSAIQNRLMQLYTPSTTGSAGTSAAGTASTETPAQQQQDAFAAFRATPGYQFGLDQGTKAVQASAAARGGLNSGATLKALTQFGNNYADQQGYTPYMNKLASLAGLGQTSTNQVGQQGTQVAGQIGANTINGGQARAGGIYGSANAWSNGASQLAQAVGQGFNSFSSPSTTSYGLGGSGSSPYSGINDGSIGNWNGSL